MDDLQQPVSINPEQQKTSPTQNKKVLFGVIAVLAALFLGGFGYLIGLNAKSLSTQNTTPQSTPSEKPTKEITVSVTTESDYFEKIELIFIAGKTFSEENPEIYIPHQVPMTLGIAQEYRFPVTDPTYINSVLLQVCKKELVDGLPGSCFNPGDIKDLITFTCPGTQEDRWCNIKGGGKVNFFIRKPTAEDIKKLDALDPPPGSRQRDPEAEKSIMCVDKCLQDGRSEAICSEECAYTPTNITSEPTPRPDQYQQ